MHVTSYQSLIRMPQSWKAKFVHVVAPAFINNDSFQGYWQAVFSVGNDFSGHKIQDCLRVIHTDIVKVWNLCDPSEVRFT